MPEKGEVNVAFNGPDRSYIGFIVGYPEDQVTVTAQEVDELAEAQARAAFEEGEKSHFQREEAQGRAYTPKTWEGWQPPTNQDVRERLAKELLTAKLNGDWDA